MLSISEKITHVRLAMRREKLDALIVLTEDPHCSEYPAVHWKFREYLSGFTGSAGTMVITEHHVGLWTDSRYYIQAQKQLKGTDIELFKFGLPGVSDYDDFLTYTLAPGSAVGVDGFTLPYSAYLKLKGKLDPFGITLRVDSDITNIVFQDRPALPTAEITETDFALEQPTRAEKLELVRAELIKNNASHYIISSLDDIAWLTNMRGTDVEFNPVFYAYMIVTPEEEYLFIDPHKLSSAVSRRLSDDGVKLSRYGNFNRDISNLPDGSVIYLDPDKTNARDALSLPTGCHKVQGKSIVEALKAVKTPGEIRHIDDAHLRDGVAMVNFLAWLERSHSNGDKQTEISVCEKLREFRSKGDRYIGESFGTIAGFGPNGAIVHYEPAAETDRAITEGFLLLDSGAQYADGTTDITRTVQFGDVPLQAKIDYTLVLKGHIVLAKSRFPEGTRAAQLDTLARMAMWQQMIDYGHGTGHGIGFYLNVHEGPQRIAKRDNGSELKAGMVTTNEPGIYREGKWGVRIENVMVCEFAGNGDFGDFLCHRPMTLCPIDTRPVVREMLTLEEIEWINDYHRLVRSKLESLVDTDSREWLDMATSEI